MRARGAVTHPKEVALVLCFALNRQPSLHMAHLYPTTQNTGCGLRILIIPSEQVPLPTLNLGTSRKISDEPWKAKK